MEKDTQPKKDSGEVLKNARRQIARSVLLALAALAVIVFACLAWLVNYGEVTASIRPFRMLASKFELASLGDAGIYDANLPEQWRIDGDPWEHDLAAGTSTGSKHSVLWRLTDESNLNNLPGSQPRGIQPGTRGKLQFYVIPKVSGTLTLSCQLEMIGLVQDEDGSFAVAPPDETLSRLLRGHLLFYRTDDQNTRAWVDCRTGSFSLELTDCQADTPIPLTIGWIWPYLLEHVRDESVVVDWMSSDSGFFFYNDGEDIPPLDLAGSYSTFDHLFNSADDYIGAHVQGVLLRFSAQSL